MKFRTLALVIVATVFFGCGENDCVTDFGIQPEDVAGDDVSDVTPPPDTNVPDDVTDARLDDTVISQETFDDAADDLPGDVPTDVPEDVVVVSAPPHANCGMPAYDLLPADAVGHVVEFEEIPLLSLDAATINSVLSQFGFEAMSPVPYGSHAFRYRYTTQDRGKLVQATGIMSFPVDTDPFTDPLPVLLYQHGTSGFSDPCAPSVESAWLEDGALGPAVSALGYIVIAPDYIGMNGFGAPSTVRHGYLVGEQTAIGAWDAVRAGLELLEMIPDHPTPMNRVALWGVSQGAHATMFTELWGPWYAPEFEVPAVVALVPPTDIMALGKTALESIDDPTGLFAVSLITMKLWYSGKTSLETVLTNQEPYFVAEQAPKLIFPQDECDIDVGIEIDPETLELSELFTQTLLDAVNSDTWEAIAPWDCYYNENSLSRTSVPALRHTPTLMIYGETDTMVITPTQRPDFTRLCEMGYKLDYLECAGAGHAAAALWSMPEQFQWIRDRFDGKPVPEQEICVIQDPVKCSATPAE